jgi:hypothetical protein
MLSKEICRACRIHTGIGWTQYDENLWGKRQVYCYVLEWAKWRWIDGEPSYQCPYTLEHILAEEHAR